MHELKFPAGTYALLGIFYPPNHPHLHPIKV